MKAAVSRRRLPFGGFPLVWLTLGLGAGLSLLLFELLGAGKNELAQQVLLIGLGSTALICSIVHGIARRASRLEEMTASQQRRLVQEVSGRRFLEAKLEVGAKELAHQEELSRILLEQSPDPTLLVDSSLRLRSVNPAVLRAFGVSAEELLDRSWEQLEILAPDALSEVNDRLKKILAGDPPLPFELEILRKGDSPCTFEINCRRIKISPREQGVLIAFRDVTQRKQLEAKVRQEARALESANQRFQEMAALKDEFVAKVSHELRTPLTSVREGIRLLLDGALGPTNETQLDFLTTMDGDIDRLTELIGNMLDISKIESGKMRLLRRRVNPAELVRMTLKSYRAISAGWEIAEQIQESVSDIFVDTNRLLQVIGNLFSNALKYGKKNGRILFRLEARNGEVAIRIQDQGEGIAPQDLSRLFRKFSQVGARGADRPRGTGLGLVVCKELVELHGGRIEVNSTVGAGATFSILLPAYSDELAFRLSFEELQSHRSGEKGEGIGIVAIQTAAGDLPSQGEELEKLAEEVRKRIHHYDVVVALQPHWVVVLAGTDLPGAAAIIRRLRQALPGGSRFGFGGALQLNDGTPAQAALVRAQESAQREFAAVTAALEEAR